MSRDNGILILKIKLNKKYVWIVIQAQCLENFEDQDWVKWYVTRYMKRCCYTIRKNVAINLARKKARQSNVEHGIFEVITKWELISDGVSFTIDRGNIIFHHIECTFEQFKQISQKYTPTYFLKVW